MSEELKDALARIACLEGEIAKRDAELAACRVAVENCELFRARIAELEADRDSHQRCAIQAMAELAAIKAQEPVAYISGCYRDVIGGKSDRTPLGAELAFVNMGWIGQIPLYAAPVSEAKAQGVVMPEPDFWLDGGATPCYYAEPLRAALNAAPAQQVSVPDGKVCIPVEVLRLYEFMAASFTPFTSQHEQIAISLRKAKAAMLAAAPAAPAADAGHVFYGMDGDHP